MSIYLKNHCGNEHGKYVKTIRLTGAMRQAMDRLEIMGKTRTKEIYNSTLKSFMAFRVGKDLQLCRLTSDIIMQYERYLYVRRGVSRNTSSFYMRVLRAVYNHAVEEGVIVDCHPFRHVYTGVDKTIKRALPLSAIRKIMQLNLDAQPRLAFARDLFMFSFYTRGMSFVDMAYLKKSDLKNGVLTYKRRKTGQCLRIKWEECMQTVINRYGCGADGCLLPIIARENIDKRTQYQNALSITNILLKKVGAMAGIETPLTTYVARHSWASIARYKNIPLSVISEGMGHENERTTRIYLASLESSVVDDANSTLLKALME